MSTTSVYIPHVFANLTADYVAERFESLRIGVVERVDLVPNVKGTAFQAFVHFQEWSDNTAAQNIKVKIEAGQQATLNYDDPWYWYLFMNKNPENKGSKSVERRVDSLERDSDILSERIYDLQDDVSDNKYYMLKDFNGRWSHIIDRLFKIESHLLLPPPLIRQENIEGEYDYVSPWNNIPTPPPTTPTNSANVPDINQDNPFQAENIYNWRRWQQLV